MSNVHAHPTVFPVVGATPVAIPSSFSRVPPRPATPHDHVWVLTAVFSVSTHDIQECVNAWMHNHTPPAIPMDYESLLDTVGPVCLKCNAPLSPKTAMLPCPVVLAPILGIANNNR